MSLFHDVMTPFAYVVQIDMPGNPIKVGMSRTVSVRYHAFIQQTPADMRLLGCTLNGRVREAEMKAALKPTIIRGEWGHPNDDLIALLAEWHRRGEWFIRHPRPKTVYAELGVAERAAKFRRCGEYISIGARAYRPAQQIIGQAEASDPLLGLHWDGFVQAASLPDLKRKDGSPAFVTPPRIAA